MTINGSKFKMGITYFYINEHFDKVEKQLVASGSCLGNRCQFKLGHPEMSIDAFLISVDGDQLTLTSMNNKPISFLAENATLPVFKNLMFRLHSSSFGNEIYFEACACR